MRHLGNLDSPEQAEKFVAYLLVQGIEGHVDTRSGPAEVWVKDEDQLTEALGELAAFQKNPTDEKYAAAVADAKAIRKAQAKKTKAMQKKIVHVARGGLDKKPHLTMILLALCALVALFTNFGMMPSGNVTDADGDGVITQVDADAIIIAHQTQPLYRWLQFVSVGPPDGEQLAKEYLDTGRQDDLRLRTASLMRGEVWRLITPIFIHYGFMHIVFNLYMLFSYGSLVERRYDWKRLLMLALLAAAIPNFVQCTVPEAWQGIAPHRAGAGYLMTSLGGMSGVVYGLFGYVWIKSIYDPKFGFRIPQSSIIIMMAWLFGCMFSAQLAQAGLPFFPPNVANWAHGIGLLVGMVVAYLQSPEGK